MSGQEIVLIAVIAVLWVALWLTTPAFLTAGSLRPLLIEVAPVALIGVGMTVVIVSAGIDVSVGSGLMVCGVITARLLVDADISLLVALVVAIAVGALLGVLNGVLIAWGRVHPIIITFGTLNVFAFVGRQIFNSKTVNGIPGTLDFFGRGDVGRTFGVPAQLPADGPHRRGRLVVPATDARPVATTTRSGATRSPPSWPVSRSGAACCTRTCSPERSSASLPSSRSPRAPRRSTSRSAPARSSR